MKYLISLVVVLYGLSVDHLHLGQSKSLHRFLLERACIEHDIPCDIFERIANVESGMNPYVKNRLNRNFTVDVGMFQINSINHAFCKKHGFNVHNIQGNINCAALLLTKLKKYKHIDSYWYARYHSKTPSKKMAYVRKLYGKTP